MTKSPTCAHLPAEVVDAACQGQCQGFTPLFGGAENDDGMSLQPGLQAQQKHSLGVIGQGRFKGPFQGPHNAQLGSLAEVVTHLREHPR